MRFVTLRGLGKSSLSQFDAGIRIDDAYLNLEASRLINCGFPSASIRSRPDRLDGLGNLVELDFIFLDAVALDRSASWPFVDSTGFEYIP